MTYPDHSFDTVVLYNAFSHIQSQWSAIEKECRRVLKDDGAIWLVGTWKMDRPDGGSFRGERRVDFLTVKLGKDAATAATPFYPLE